MHKIQPGTVKSSEWRRNVIARLQRLRVLLSSPVMRRVWQVLTVLSLVAALLSTVYLWEQLEAGIIHFTPAYLVLALVIYVITYIQRLYGWQATATYFFGKLSLRDNAEAAAASTLLKFLPTVAWYIANRVHFYTRRDIPRRAVIAASLFELVAMTASGALLYGIYWLTRHASWGTFLVVAVIVGATIALSRPSGALRTWWNDRIISNIVVPNRQGNQQRLLWFAFLWYGSSWVLSFAFFWTMCGVLIPLRVQDIDPLLDAWLLSNLVNNLLSFTLGAVPIAREVTLSVMLAQTWPWPVAIAAVALVKLYFTFGDIVCSAVVLAWAYFVPRKSDA